MEMVRRYTYYLIFTALTYALLKIFILEGLLTVVVGAASKFWIPDWPETAEFLTEDERAMLVARLYADTGDAKMDHLDKRAFHRIAKDWKIYVGTMAYMGVLNNGYAGSVSSPFVSASGDNHDPEEMTMANVYWDQSSSYPPF